MARTSRRLLVAAVVTVGLTAWVASEPGRARYLANVVRQVHHLPGRYAV